MNMTEFLHELEKTREKNEGPFLHFYTQTVTWDSGKAFCSSLGKKLCSSQEVCSMDDEGGRNLIPDLLSGDHWVPVLDKSNQWLQVGDSSGDFLSINLSNITSRKKLCYILLSQFNYNIHFILLVLFRLISFPPYSFVTCVVLVTYAKILLHIHVAITRNGISGISLLSIRLCPQLSTSARFLSCILF